MAEFSLEMARDSWKERLEQETDPQLRDIIGRMIGLVTRRAELVQLGILVQEADDAGAEEQIRDEEEEIDAKVHDLSDEYSFLKMARRQSGNEPKNPKVQ